MSGKKKKPKRPARDFGMGDDGAKLEDVLAGETDRGCVLVAAEFISDALGRMLRERFAKSGLNKDAQDELLSNAMGPLFSFGMRVKLSRAFGLIDSNKLFRPLETFREIRNLCAHSAGTIDLSDPIFAEYVRALDGYLTTTVNLGHIKLWERYPQIEQFSKERKTVMDAAFYLWIFSTYGIFLHSNDRLPIGYVSPRSQNAQEQKPQ